MNQYLQFSLATALLIFTFLFLSLTLPSVIDLWQDYIDEQRKRRERKNKCPR